AFGAACLAGLGHGIYKSLDDIARLWEGDVRCEPKLDATARAKEMDGWRTALARVRSRGTTPPRPRRRSRSLEPLTDVLTLSSIQSQPKFGATPEGVLPCPRPFVIAHVLQFGLVHLRSYLTTEVLEASGISNDPLDACAVSTAQPANP